MGNDSRQGRKQQRRSGWKWTVIAGITALVVVLVFVLGMALGRGRHNRLDVASSSTAVTSSSQSTSSSTSSVDTSSSVVASENTDPYHYAVKPDDFDNVTFEHNTTDAPIEFTVAKVNDGNFPYMITVTLPHDAGEIELGAEMTNVATKRMRIFGATQDNLGVRTIKANTQFRVVQVIDGGDGTAGGEDDGNRYVGERYYVFYNSKGTLSLATPNYAGNTGEDELDVKMEYVQE